MQDQAMARATEQSAAEKHLGAQRGGLPIGAEAAGALEFSQWIKQQQDAAEGRFGGEELLQTKVIGGQVVFQFGDAIFHVRPAVVITPARAALTNDPVPDGKNWVFPAKRELGWGSLDEEALISATTP